MTLEEFKTDIYENIKSMPDNWREGQKIFNYVDEQYGVARSVQFNLYIDCFYNDNMIEPFINACYKLIQKNESR